VRSASAYDWTPAAIDRLKDLWREGHSGSHVATLMGGGLTRCAVLGKIHRLGMSGERRPHVAPARIYKRVRAPVAKRAYTPPVKPARPPPRVFRLTLLDLQPWSCRWPQGEQEYRFCGEPRVDESSYCGPHTRLSLRAA
jgi:GcrA cell cycle regulator